MSELRFNKVGVDAGIIMICDEDYYKDYGFEFNERISKKRKISPGKYNCKWNIPKTWNGNVKGEGILEITSGNMIVSDPCYCIQHENNDNWDRFLKDTDFANKPKQGTVVLDKMGGDGQYTVYISLEKIGE